MKLLAVFLLAVAFMPHILTDNTPEISGCNCPQYYDPICATDFNTYTNICWLDCENLKRAEQGLPPLLILYNGPCPCNCDCRHCPLTYNPVCGSDNRTHRNVCWMLCYSNCNVDKGLPPITLVKVGPC